MCPDDLFEEDEFEDYAPSRGLVEPKNENHPGVPIGKASESILTGQPLADRLRPMVFEDYHGQQHLVAKGAPLRQLIEADKIPSMIFWGPPGTGKTTLASLIARATESDFIVLSAVTSGLKDVRTVISHAKVNRQHARRTVLFVDEIHRFNKAQQDAFLPHVESGLITFIGATTENPSFTVISALLSRTRVFTLKPLGNQDLERVLTAGLQDLQKRLAGERRSPFEMPKETYEALIKLCDGDARRALTLLESAAIVTLQRESEEEIDGRKNLIITPQLLADLAQQQLIYDKDGEDHFNCISALHKTIRSSDPHGAAYWAGRMLAAGEDPRYLMRRLIRMAGEDIGLADPQALPQAVACQRAYETLGSPEGDLFIIQLSIFLALAPKSNAIYNAHKAVAEKIRETGSLPVPLNLRNAPTTLMKSEGYGHGYQYDHDAEGHFAPKQGLPDALEGLQFYKPTTQGREKALAERLEQLDCARQRERENRGNQDS
ncbi:MAG: replication-associated recombination protein A [Sumerlaeia bacterium]